MKKKRKNSELLLSLLFANGNKTNTQYILNIDNDIMSANTYANDLFQIYYIDFIVLKKKISKKSKYFKINLSYLKFFIH
jgi:hypothetical protein